MPKTFNWGIIGAGKIAGKFAADLAAIPNANCYAIASRSAEKASVFAEQYGFAKSYDNYEALAKDPDVAVIYIATPHVFHCEHTLLCLENKKAVLCEKPFAMNKKEVELMIQRARKNKVFLMDALWTLCLPHILKTKQIIEGEQLGKLVSMRADFGFNATYNPDSRLFSNALGGGSLLDVGIYPLLLSLFIFGKPSKILAAAHIGKTSVDEDCGIILQYEEGQMAHLHSSFQARTPVEAYIYCEKGYIHIPSRFHEAVKSISIMEYEGLKKTEIPFDYQVKGYKYEAEEVMRCLQAGKLESDLVPHQFSLYLMELMDVIRSNIGLVYPNHD